MGQKYFIFAEIGTGKTFVSHNYENASEVEYDDHKYVFDRDLSMEDKKCDPNRKSNPCWPDNYIAAALAALEKYDVVMAPLFVDPFAALIDTVEHAKTKIILALPAKECKDEYLQRWKNRGNNNIFLEVAVSSFRYNQLFHSITDYEKIIMRPGQYLDEALIEYGIELKPKSLLP